jgi:hypothetical protein
LRGKGFQNLERAALGAFASKELWRKPFARSAENPLMSISKDSDKKQPHPDRSAEIQSEVTQAKPPSFPGRPHLENPAAKHVKSKRLLETLPSDCQINDLLSRCGAGRSEIEKDHIVASFMAKVG